MLQYLASECKNERLFAQENDARSPFERDRDRIIHSIAFRRLQYKTQVFINYEGDHYRTRLTHSLEVAQIARSIARRLGVNEDLCEVIALAHDLGHPPFGHNGEYALQDATELYGGFDHNAQTLRIVCMLENRHVPFDGLNLTFSSIDGIMKHNGPIDLNLYRLRKGRNAANTIEKVANLYNINLTQHTSIEAQIAAIADDIAYCNHDIDDGIRANLITLEELVEIEEIQKITKHLPIKGPRSVSGFVRYLTSYMIEDVIAHTIHKVSKNNITSDYDIINYGEVMVNMSQETCILMKRLKSVLFERIYNYTKKSGIGKKSKIIVNRLFYYFFNNLSALPISWQKKLSFEAPAIVVIDYIAGMTDRYAIEKYEDLGSS